MDEMRLDVKYTCNKNLRVKNLITLNKFPAIRASAVSISTSFLPSHPIETCH